MLKNNEIGNLMTNQITALQEQMSGRSAKVDVPGSSNRSCAGFKRMQHSGVSLATPR
jgi:hypothetical protein